MDIIKIKEEEFEEKVLKNNKKVLVDFYADWCGPCRMVSPLVDQIAEENPQYFIGKINVENEPEIANAFGVSSIPMLVVIKNGKIVNQSVGAKPKQQILDMLES